MLRDRFRRGGAGGKRNAVDFVLPPTYRQASFRDFADLPGRDRMCTKSPDTPVIVDHLCRFLNADERGRFTRKTAEELFFKPRKK